MKALWLINYLLTAWFTIDGSAESGLERVSGVYPVPPTNENSLFYIQRSKNTNAIVYELNRKPNNTLDAENPIKVYWIRYTSDSSTAALTSIQRKYAYGVLSRPYQGYHDSYVVQFAAYRKRNIFLMPNGNSGKYGAYVSINGKMAELKKIFIATEGGTFWFPKIAYVELTGMDPSSGKHVVERFVP